MKYTWAVVNVLLGLAAAGPLSGSGNEIEVRDSKKCKYKTKVCCKYQDSDFDTAVYESGQYTQYSRTIYVKHGKSIQKAINSAVNGDKIVVAAGTYAEQLTIGTDGIQLIGQGVVLVPPTKPIKNTCSGLTGKDTQAGICVTGRGIKLAPFISEHRKVKSVKSHVKRVQVTGFEVHGFSGVNIAVVGALSAHVVNNTLKDAGGYGGLTIGSVNTVFENNVVTQSKDIGFIGICMDNQSGVLINNNKVSNQYVGLCVQTNKADVQYNKVSGCCFGVFVDPGVDGAKVRHNTISGTNSICANFGGNTGIVLDGAKNTKVLDNLIEKQKLGGKSAGIAIFDDPCSGDQQSLSCLSLGHKAIASGNVVLRNTFVKNDFDIYVNTTSTTNVFACNKCSTPGKYCKS